MIPGMSPALIALVLVTALLSLVPARRLHLAGWSQAVVAGYFVALWVASVAVAWAPGATRLLVPIVIVAYLAPFVTLRAGLDRLRGGPRPPGPRRISPPDDGPGSGAR
jgi:hypothetical protein